MFNNEKVSKIIESMRLQEPHALDDFLQQVAPTLHKYGLRMCRNEQDAQDIMQESMIAAMKNIGNFRGDSSVSTWLYTIARSFCIKKRRKSKFSPKQVESISSLHADVLRVEAKALDAVHQDQFELALNNALDALEVGQKDVFLLRDMEGLSTKEVANTLKITEAAVKSKLHRSRANIQAAMTEWFAETEKVVVGSNNYKQESCSHTKEISNIFSRFLEGELDSSICTKVKVHVNQCPQCKPVCNCLQNIFDICQQNQNKNSYKLSASEFIKLKKAVAKCH